MSYSIGIIFTYARGKICCSAAGNQYRCSTYNNGYGIEYINRRKSIRSNKITNYKSIYCYEKQCGKVSKKHWRKILQKLFHGKISGHLKTIF